MPNRENIRKWVAALRSGDFAQTRGALHRAENHASGEPGGYCCLGVACEVSGLGSFSVRDGAPTGDGLEFVVEGVDYSGPHYPKTGVLPLEVMDWLGVDHDNPVLDAGEKGRHQAASLNDFDRLSFEQIADAIERTFLADEDEPAEPQPIGI